MLFLSCFISIKEFHDMRISECPIPKHCVPKTSQSRLPYYAAPRLAGEDNLLRPSTMGHKRYIREYGKCYQGYMGLKLPRAGCLGQLKFPGWKLLCSPPQPIPIFSRMYFGLKSLCRQILLEYVTWFLSIQIFYTLNHIIERYKAC